MCIKTFRYASFQLKNFKDQRKATKSKMKQINVQIQSLQQKKGPDL